MATTFTLTGTFKHQDGVTPIVGSGINVKAAPYPDASLHVYLTRGVNKSTDANGSFSVALESRSGLYYTIRSLANSPLFQPIVFLAPSAGTTVDITALTYYNPTGVPPSESVVAGYAAAAAAAAASVNREANSGVAGLDVNGLPIRSVPLWRASTTVATGATWQAPDGSLIKRTSGGTTRASFDSTEQAAWTPVSTTAGTIERAALDLAYPARRAALTTVAGTFHKSVLDANFFFIGADSTDRGYWSNGASGIFQSDDGLATRSTSKGFPSGTGANAGMKMLDFKGNLYLLTQSTGTGTPPQVWKTSRSGVLGTDSTAFSWTGPQWTGAQLATTAVTTIFNADASYMYVAEYGDPALGPAAYRSSDGTTWTQIIAPSTANRHIHAINPDPYNPGHVWVTWGDGGTRIIERSTDYGSTWSAIVTANADWQAVQISFTSTHVWFAADNRLSTAFVYDKVSGTFFDGTASTHRHVAVPGPVPRIGSNRVTDGAFTNGTKTMTSATAAFTADDVGREVFNGTCLPSGRSWIQTFTNSTTVQLFDAATSNGSTQTVTFADEQFHANADLGAVDPATGIYYCFAFIGAGQRCGFFYAPGVGQAVHLLDALPQITLGSFWEVFFHKGYVWCGKWKTPMRS